MSDVADTFAAWSATSNSNSPAGSTNIAAGLDDNLRQVQGVIVRGLSHKGSDIASSTAPALGATEGLMHDITGTATITGFDTVREGIWKIIKFEGAVTLTHNATNLILPGSANITTADGDVALLISEGSGNWRCLGYMKAASIAATIAGAETLTNKTLTAPAFNGALSGDAIALQAEMETGTATDSIVSPGRQHFHPSSPKAWGTVTTPTTVSLAYPASGVSVVKNGTGDYTVTHGITFSGTSFAVVLSVRGATLAIWTISATAATTFRVLFFADMGGITPVDPQAFSYSLFGDI